MTRMGTAPTSENRTPTPRQAGTVVVLRDGNPGLEVLLLRRSTASRAFPGAWVFPGGTVEPADGAPEDPMTPARAAARETAEEAGLELDASGLTPWSVWFPPAGSPVTSPTWFFLATAPDAEVVVDGEEIIDADWSRPGDALDSHAVGAITLMPPTWITLGELAGLGSARAALAAAPTVVSQYRTRIERHDDRTRLSWPERPEVLDISALPWRLVHGSGG